MKKSLLFVVFSLIAIICSSQVPEFWGLAGCSGGYGYGTRTVVFKIKGDGSDFRIVDTVGYCEQFSGNLFQASNGKLYGILPSGTIFSIDPTNDNYTVCGGVGCYTNVGCACIPQACSHGFYPNPNFVEGKNGILYGNMYDRMFSFNLSDNSHIVYTSTIPNNEGINSFVLATNGKIYLTANNISNGNTGGSLYSFDTAAHSFTMLEHWNFGFGVMPLKILQANNGLLYGIIYHQDSQAKIFSYNIPAATSTTILDFYSVPTYLYDPQGLIQGADGKLYGTCRNDGIYSLDISNGNLFAMRHNFLFGAPDSMGKGPINDLTLASDCNIYGMAGGGTDSVGVFFKFDPIANIYSKIFDLKRNTIRNSWIGVLTEINPTHCAVTNIDVFQNEIFSISPNPATNSVTLTLNENMLGSTATITDITGRKMAAAQLQTLNYELETSAFANGVYFITLESEKGRATKKLVINH